MKTMNKYFFRTSTGEFTKRELARDINQDTNKYYHFFNHERVHVNKTYRIRIVSDYDGIYGLVLFDTQNEYTDEEVKNMMMEELTFGLRHVKESHQREQERWEQAIVQLKEV